MKTHAIGNDTGASTAILSADSDGESPARIGDLVGTVPDRTDGLLRSDLTAVLDALLKMSDGK